MLCIGYLEKLFFRQSNYQFRKAKAAVENAADRPSSYGDPSGNDVQCVCFCPKELCRVV